MIKIKLFLKSILYRWTHPLLTYYLLPILTKNNLYVDILYLDKNLLCTLQSLQNYQKFTVTSTGVLILFHTYSVTKIPLGPVSKASLAANFKNFNLLRKSKFHLLVNYKLTKTDTYYKMQKLQTTSIREKTLNKILEKFSFKKSQIKLGLFKNELFMNLSKIESLCNIAIYFPSETDIYSVAMHGDFTQNNIMLNQENKLVLIDLDRFTFHGIKNIDKLQYKIENSSITRNISFFEALEIEMKSAISKEQFNYLYLYFLLRICYEYNDSIKLPMTYYESVKNLILKFNIHFQGSNECIF